jgi:hypothetical protein
MGDFEPISEGGDMRKLPDDILQLTTHAYQNIIKKNIPKPCANSVLPLLQRKRVLPKNLDDMIEENRGSMGRQTYLLSHMEFYSVIGQYIH